MSNTETWIAAEAESSRVGLPVVASPSGRLICNVNCVADPLHGKVPGDDKFNREALAHARLIAAAPELLAALKECLWLLSDIQDAPGLVQEKAREAVAKAEGHA